MDITAPVTDYIRGSVLTSRGSIITHDGSGPVQMYLGRSHHTLKVNDAGVDLEYRAPVELVFEVEHTAFNAGAVTILSTATTLASIDLGTLKADSRILINANVDSMKGGTPGNNIFQCGKLSGTATIQCLRARVDIQKEWWQIASEYNRQVMSGIFRVITDGTLVLYTLGQSAGSDSTVAIGSAELYANVYKYYY